MKNIFRLLFLVFCLFTTTISLHAQWIATNTGLTDSDIRCFAVSGANLFAGTYASYGGGVFLSTNNGTSWTRIYAWEYSVHALTVSGTNLFAAANGVFLSTDNGTSWTAVNSGLISTTVYALAVSGTNLFAGTSGGVFLSTNNGTSWTAVNTGLINVTKRSRYVETLAISGTNLFAGTDDGVFLSTNNGTSWNAVNSGLTNTSINVLAISSTNLFAGTGDGVFLSTNNGTSWTAENTGLTYVGAEALAVSGTNLFDGNVEGVFLSTNNGTSWAAASRGANNIYNVNTLTISGTYLYAGTIDNGVWRRPLSEMINTRVEDRNNQIPNHFSLHQNYPNPFNPSTVISYQIASAGKVSLKVYDMLGREVATLVNETKSAGNYTATFNATKLPSGVYFYRLQAGTYSNTKKLLLLK